MTVEELKLKIHNLSKARQMDIPGITGVTQTVFLEFVRYVAGAGDDNLKQMANYLLLQYPWDLEIDSPNHNILQEIMQQIQQDMINGAIDFELDGDTRIFKGTNVMVFKDNDGVTIRKSNNRV